MKNILIGLIIIAFTAPVYGQVTYSTDKKNAIKAYEEGVQYLNLRDVSRAIGLFSKAISIDDSFIEAYMILAQAYEDSKQYEKAIETYQSARLINLQFYPPGYIFQGNLEYKIARYADAIKSYEAYLATGSKIKKSVDAANKGLTRCKFAIEAMNNPVEFEPINLGANINTSYDEYWPCLTADERTLIFTRMIRDSASQVGFQEDFFISTRDNDNWNLAVNAGAPLNSRYNDGAQSISADGRFMVFTSCGRKDGQGRCDLYFSSKTGDTWTEPKNMGTPVNTGYNETQPSLSADGKILYFASDRAGGFGDIDIYYTVSDGFGNWGVPVNLGETINTTGRDWAPFIHPDNQTLYFASNEHLGLGGFDLFYSRKNSSGKWTKPVNLGYPINTHHDEYGLIISASGKYALYSSNRDSANGRDIFKFDIHESARPTSVSYMKGKVYDADSKRLLGAGFELIDLKSGQVIFNSFSDSITGEFLVCIPAENNYLLNVSKPGYLFYSDNFLLDGVYQVSEPFLKDVPLNPIAVGKSVVLKNIFYEFDSYNLKNESMIELDKLVQFLKTYPQVKIEVGGHTDNIGTEEYNNSLSTQRAKSVMDYLIASSVTKERIKFKGYGYSKPVADNDTEEGRTLNRRTELVILEK